MRRKIYGQQRKRKTDKEEEEKKLEMENIQSAEEKKTEKKEKEIFLRTKIIGQWRDRIVCLVDT